MVVKLFLINKEQNKKEGMKICSQKCNTNLEKNAG